MNLKALSKQIEPEVIAWRRYVHEHPELGWHESGTTAFIEQKLKAFGIETQRLFAATGVAGILHGTAPGRTIGLRADIDALEGTEQTGLPFASKQPGAVHACGHDAHIAMLLGAAKLLSGLKDRLHGTVVFLFQPAEEGRGGAKKILAETHILDKIDALEAIHVWPSLPAGKVCIDAGPRMAASGQFKITIHGKTGHGSLPHQGIDAISAGAAVLTNLQHLNAWEINTLDPCVITVCKFQAGTRWNVICDEAILEGTTRFYNPSLNEALPQMMKRIIDNTAASFRTTADFEYVLQAPAVINDQELTKVARNAVKETYGAEALISTPPYMIGDDFGFWAQQIPTSVFALLGAGHTDGTEDFPLHDPRFNLDEKALKIGVALHGQCALDFLAE